LINCTTGRALERNGECSVRKEWVEREKKEKGSLDFIKYQTSGTKEGNDPLLKVRDPLTHQTHGPNQATIRTGPWTTHFLSFRCFVLRTE
jgi:hypothetical protein